MSYEAVNLFVRDKATGAPLSAVLVKVFDAGGVVVHGESLSDQDGIAYFLLPAGATYQARLYKQQVRFKLPKFFSVLSGEPNSFDIEGELLIPPTATDPRFCMASGYFRHVDGRPYEGLRIHLTPMFSPVYVDGAGLTTEGTTLVTDKTGYVQISLLRFSQYLAVVEGVEDRAQVIEAPDLPSANLLDMLFPVVSRIRFEPNPVPTELVVGQPVTLTPLVLMASGASYFGTRTDKLLWESSDNSLLEVAVEQDTITLRAVQAGLAELRATRLGSHGVRIPNAPLLGVPLTFSMT